MDATKVFSVIIMALSTSLTMGCEGAESEDVDESEAALVAAESPLASPPRVAIQVRPSFPSHAMPGPDDDEEPGPPHIGSPHGPAAGLDDDDDCAQVPHVGPWHDQPAMGSKAAR